MLLCLAKGLGLPASLSSSSRAAYLPQAASVASVKLASFHLYRCAVDVRYEDRCFSVHLANVVLRMDCWRAWKPWCWAYATGFVPPCKVGTMVHTQTDDASTCLQLELATSKGVVCAMITVLDRHWPIDSLEATVLRP